MNKINIIKPFQVLFVLMILLSTAMGEEASPLCTNYQLQGSGALGAYSGEMQVWDNHRVFRQITYQNKWQNKYKVQEFWEGQFISDNIIRFEVKNHQFLSEVDNLKITKEEFQKKEMIYLDLNSDEIKISIVHCTPWTDVDNLRLKNLILQNHKNPFLVNLAKLLVINPIISWYKEQSIVDDYRDNPDFKNDRYYSVDDLTDFNFYRNNKTTLRLRNVTTNEFTLNESFLRRSAYAYTLEEKAQIMNKSTSENNINSVGLFYHKIKDKNYPDGDSALWTAMYMSSEGAKYLTTNDPESLSNFKKSLNGMLLLLEITDNPNEFARSIMPNDGVSQVNSKWKQGTGKYQNLHWLPGGNNDMIKGLILGLAWGYKILPKSDPLFSRMLNAVEELKNIKLKRLGGLNQSYIYALDSIFNSSPDSYVRFIEFYIRNQNTLELLGLNRQFYDKGVADWSGLNLATISALSFYLISDEIIKKWPQLPISLSGDDQIPDYSRDARWVKKQQKSTIQLMDEVFKYTKRDFICLMNYSLNSELGPAPKKCFLSLLETPAEIPEVSLGFDNRLREDFSYASTPDLPWKLFGKREASKIYLVNNQIYPKFETDAFSSQMMWKEAFSLADRKPEGAIVPRLDYLFTYWTYRMFQKNVAELEQ